MADMVDVFINSKVDIRIIHRLPTLALSYLPVRDVIPHVPRTCKYLNDVVVWNKRSSGPLLWGEMARGTLDERVFKGWVGDMYQNGVALIRACDRGAPVVHVLALISGGANVNAVDGIGKTALYWASDCGREDIVRALLNNGADPDITSNSGWTPLMMATHPSVSSSVTSALVAAGSRLNHVDHSGYTALMWACSYDNVDCAKILIESRTDVTMRNIGGQTALDIASVRGYYDIVHILERSYEFDVSDE
jgi:hypothetical protein